MNNQKKTEELENEFNVLILMIIGLLEIFNSCARVNYNAVFDSQISRINEKIKQLKNIE